MASLLALPLLLVTCFFDVVAFNVDQEPLCLSRYDYDHKILLAIVTLQHEQKELTELVTKQSKAIAENEKTHEDLKQLVTKQSETIADMENMQKSLKQLVDNQSEIIRRHGDQIDGINSTCREEAPSSMATTGTTFIRWGRTTCPGNGTDTVYNGYAGGSSHSDKGAAVDYLCLPTEPLWGKFTTGLSVNYVYGVEYEITGSGSQNLFNKDIGEHDAPCAVCHSVRSSTMMIPGRNACYDGWTKEYAGTLVSGYYAHNAASEFVCLDNDPEVVPGSGSSLNGKLMYVVEARCGSLKCPPYINKQTLACVVCTL